MLCTSSHLINTRMITFDTWDETLIAGLIRLSFYYLWPFLPLNLITVYKCKILIFKGRKSKPLPLATRTCNQKPHLTIKLIKWAQRDELSHQDSLGEAKKHLQFVVTSPMDFSNFLIHYSGYNYGILAPPPQVLQLKGRAWAFLALD